MCFSGSNPCSVLTGPHRVYIPGADGPPPPPPLGRRQTAAGQLVMLLWDPWRVLTRQTVLAFLTPSGGDWTYRTLIIPVSLIPMTAAKEIHISTASSFTCMCWQQREYHWECPPGSGHALWHTGRAHFACCLPQVGGHLGSKFLGHCL